MPKKKKVYIGLICLIILGFLFFKAGVYLNLNKQSANSSGSIAFLLVGNLRDRTLALSELYNSGKVNSVVYAKTKDTDFKYLDSLGVDVCRDTDKIKLALIQLGIPSTKITQLESQNRSTIDEANVLREYLSVHQDINKVTLVTSSYHSRRAYLIVKNRLKSLNRSLTIDVYPNSYTNTNLKKWWKNKEDAVVVITEYMKILSFLLWEQFN
jgi:uncharacterized SAM-binding protein YcdF (DUF218 family)